jgi:hypothetical protein
MHFGFLRLPHIFWMRCYLRMWCILMIFSPRKCLGCFGKFVQMCSSPTFLCHVEITSFFLLVFFRFRQENYANMWQHYGFWIMGVFLRPLNEGSCLTIDILWWYRLFFYGGLCTIYFFRELGFSGFIFVLQVSYFR